MKTITQFLILLAFTSFAILPTAKPVSPPPDGCYPAYTTAVGCNALQSLTTGVTNTGIGWYSLFGNSVGSYNTAVGAGALDLNNADNNTATGVGALLLNTIGTQNTATGSFALYNNSVGGGNIALGYLAGSALTTGNNNIAIGNIGVAGESNTIRIGDPAIHEATFVAGIIPMSPAAPNQAVLMNPATGQLGSADTSSFGVVSTDPENTAVGDQALVSSTGESNTATGFRSLFSDTTGMRNTATGAHALENNITGDFNDAVGVIALASNLDGASNNAFGDSALSLNIHASENTGIGDFALANNDSTGNGTAEANTAVGARALYANTDGEANNAVGDSALFYNTTGTANVAIGTSALSQNVNGSYNTVIGSFAGASVEGNDNIYIGATSADGVTNESSTIRIGDPAFVTACYVAGINGQIASGGVQVFVNADGKLGTLTSSARFKADIKPMGGASESILALQPVTFHYKPEIDAQEIPQFGLLAEDVEKVNPDLVVRDKQGRAYSVRYDQVNAMLLNEFLKAHRKLEQQETMIARQQKQIEALTAGLQKVSTQVELSRSAPRRVADDR
jgi:hypothetical protein